MNTNFFDLSKRKKRDVLSDLLADVSREGIISKKELHALNNLIESSSEKKTPATLRKQPTKIKQSSAEGKKNQKPEKKITHYLSQGIYNNLNNAQITIRRLVPAELQSSISKSFLVNISLEIILQEFKDKGKKSKLVHKIMQKT